MGLCLNLRNSQAGVWSRVPDEAGRDDSHKGGLTPLSRGYSRTMHIGGVMAMAGLILPGGDTIAIALAIIAVVLVGSALALSRRGRRP
jgi:hypothetical protein